MQGDGYLAIWSDLTPEDETDWAHWITREHAAERVGVPGFLACRIFRAIGTTANRYFILYELEDENVVGSAARLKSGCRGSSRLSGSDAAGCGGVAPVEPEDDVCADANAGVRMSAKTRHALGMTDVRIFIGAR